MSLAPGSRISRRTGPSAPVLHARRLRIYQNPILHWQLHRRRALPALSYPALSPKGCGAEEVGRGAGEQGRTEVLIWMSQRDAAPGSSSGAGRHGSAHLDRSHVPLAARAFPQFYVPKLPIGQFCVLPPKIAPRRRSDLSLLFQIEPGSMPVVLSRKKMSA